ncbi:MAG: HDIG domain-containing protein [Tepidanaerobacter sp.]|jgi:putative nucleotidyltransferase with HDIG domain|nr:HDIG domain-containing protein [Tepidanaerobacter sp.]HQE05424.1 HDIG domain-containing protein [Tepidanaerobacteraceae bacterium]
MIKTVIPIKMQKLAFNKSVLQKLAMGLFFFASLSAMMFFSALPQKYDVEVGQVLQENILARNEAINTIATSKLRQAAADQVPKKYTLNHTITAEVKNNVTDILNYVKEVRNRTYLEDQEKVKLLMDRVSSQISEESYFMLMSMSETSLKELETVTKAIIETVMEEGVKEDSIDRTKTYVIEEFKSLNIPQELKGIGEEIALLTIRPNMVYDREATERQQREAMEAIAPVRVFPNQVLIEKGTVITSEHIEMLKEMGLLARDRKADISLLIGVMCVSAFLVASLTFAVYYFHRDVYNNNLYLTLLILIILSTLIISLGVKNISNYLIPLAAGSMLISILINPQVAVFASFTMSVVVGIMLGNDFSHALVALSGALIGIFCTAKVSQRSDLTKAGGIIGGAKFILITGTMLLNNSTALEILKESPWGLVSGILSAILAIGTLPFLENAFGITSAIKLLELSNPNQPLLRKLMLDAPGTYHHCIIVGNLAEAGAEAVGADSLLARVGANYHDIGKLKRPYFFIENQLTSDNPHDKLSPTLSALIITSHVKDGVEIAKEYRLPDCITDFIVQHHGTSLLSFFYQKALESADEKKPDEASFRYEGPKPKTREAAIVMLADCVEAAVRSLPKPTHGKIEGLIRQIIKDKLSDGQLDECDLTLKDLDKIAVAFSKIMTGIFHTRIEYPDKLKELQRKDLNNGQYNDKQFARQN